MHKRFKKIQLLAVVFVCALIVPNLVHAREGYLQRVFENEEARGGYEKTVCLLNSSGVSITKLSETGKVISQEGPSAIHWGKFSADHRWSAVENLMAKAASAPFTPSPRGRTAPAAAYRMSLDGKKLKILHVHQGVRVIGNYSDEALDLMHLMFDNCKSARESMDPHLK